MVQMAAFDQSCLALCLILTGVDPSRQPRQHSPNPDLGQKDPLAAHEAASDRTCPAPTDHDPFHRHLRHDLGPNLDREAPLMNEMAASDPSSLAPMAHDPFHCHLRRVHDPNLHQEAPSVVQMAASDLSSLAPTAQNLFRCHPQHVLGPNLDQEAPLIVPMAVSYPLCLTLAARDPYVLDPNLDRAALSYQAPASLDSSHCHCRLAHGPNLDLVDLSMTATVLLLRRDSCPPDPYRHSLRPDLYPTLDDRGVHHCSRPEDGDVYSRGRCRPYPLPSRRPSWRRSPSSPQRRARLPLPLEQKSWCLAILHS